MPAEGATSPLCRHRELVFIAITNIVLILCRLGTTSSPTCIDAFIVVAGYVIIAGCIIPVPHTVVNPPPELQSTVQRIRLHRHYQYSANSLGFQLSPVAAPVNPAAEAAAAAAWQPLQPASVPRQ